MSYIKAIDIKSQLVNGVDLTPYMDECDDAIEDLAEVLGVRTTTDIETAPLHFQIKQYGINFILMRVCEDRMGVCNPESVAFDKYFNLAEYYKRRTAEYRKMISTEMVTGNVDQIRDRAAMSGMIFRG